MQLARVGWLTLALLPWLSSLAHSAPPVVTYLFPAGAQRGTKLTVTAGGTFERWPLQAWTECKDLDIRSGKTSGQLEIAVAPDAEPGVHWIRLFDKEGASLLRPFLVGTLPEVLEKEPNDEPKKPQALPGNAVVNGRLEKPGDVDVFAVNLTKGQTLVASLEAFRTLRSPMDGILQILSPDGFVLEQNNDYHELDPQIIFPVPKDGTYFVRLFAFPSVPDSAIRLAGKEEYIYRLTLTTGGFVEYSLPLAIGPKQGTVELVGWNLPEDLRLFPVATRPGVDVVNLAHPQVANSWLVRIDPLAVAFPARRKKAEPVPIVLPVAITGRLDQPGDVDVYQFEAKKGAKVPLRLESRSLGFPLDAVLSAFDADGKMLAQAQAKALGTDPLLDVTIPQDGKYRLEVRDLFAQGSLRHVYRLQAGLPAPGFDVKVANERFGLTPGKPLDIPVTVELRGGLKGDIDLVVEGLPPAITATTTTQGKVVTLRLDAPEKTEFSGPFRILGKVKGQEDIVRPAVANVAELGATTTHFWLTVPGTVVAPSKKKK